jgi:hypothetical protein
MTPLSDPRIPIAVLPTGTRSGAFYFINRTVSTFYLVTQSELLIRTPTFFNSQLYFKSNNALDIAVRLREGLSELSRPQ